MRAFFADTRNFVEMMPNVGGIRMDNNGIAHWTIRAEIPVLGGLDETFAVKLMENSPNLIEYSPASIETKNFLRYAADFVESGDKTAIQISQTVELRRESASELHFLAPLAGEKIISAEMQKRVSAMIKSFLEKAKIKLEEKS